MLVSVALPWFVGAAAWHLLVGEVRGRGHMALTLGAGYLVGCVGLGAALRAYPAAAPVSGMFGSLAWWLLAVGVALLVAPFVWRRWGMSRRPAVARPPLPDDEASTARWPVALLVLAIVAFGVLVLVQAVQLPTIGWDAWNAWFAKSKSWVLADRLLPVREPHAWLAATPGGTVAAIASHYPEALPRLVAWVASATGGWNEAAVHLPWPLAWCALGLLLWGAQRAAGASRLHATLVAIGLLTLPLVVAHAALAGYADLWLAALLLLVLVHCERWLRTRVWQDGVAALLAAALLPAVKQEGAVWLACIAAAMVLALLPRRVRWIALGGAVVMLLASLPFGGLSLPLPGLGWVELGWGVAVVPGVGTLQLHWRPVLAPVLDSLFLRDHWNLLWYLAPLVLLASRRALAQPSLAALGWFFAFGFAFQIVLFFFTDASRWAENLTSINRILLQVVPGFVYWLSLLWLQRGAGRDTPRPAHD